MEGSTLFEWADRLKALRDRKEALEAELKQVNVDIDDADWHLSNLMAESETQNFTRAGTMFCLTTKTRANAAPGRKDELFDALRADWQIRASHVEKTALGRPYLPGADMPFISLSHTRGFVCCAVSQVPVGVDCERYRRVTEGAMRRVCTPEELADIAAAADPPARFLQYWTLKESISKKRGVGLSESFQAYAVRFEGERPVCPGYKLHFEMRDGFFLAAAE